MMKKIDNNRQKLPLIYEYLKRVLIDTKAAVTLCARLQRYLVSIYSLKEPNLSSSGIIEARLKQMTVLNPNQFLAYSDHVPIAIEID